MANHPNRSQSARIKAQEDTLKWILARAEYARDYCGDENRKDIVAEIARIALKALTEQTR